MKKYLITVKNPIQPIKPIKPIKLTVHKQISGSAPTAQLGQLIDLRTKAAPPTQIETTTVRILKSLTQLVELTEQQTKSSLGDERKRNQMRLAQFRKAVNTIRSCGHEITSGAQARELPGIGKGIADRIDEILRTGTLAELTGGTDQLVHSGSAPVVAGSTPPVDPIVRIVNELMTVTGIGEANAKKFVEQGVTGVADLAAKAAAGSIKITHHMQIGLKYYRDFEQKISYDEIEELSQMIRQVLTSIDPQLMFEVCGSHRRQLPFSGDIDVLITHARIVTDDDLIASPRRYLKEIIAGLKSNQVIIDDLTSQGDTKYMGVCLHPVHRIGRRIDIRFVTRDSYYPAVLYFTGSMQTNKLMRTVALEKGYTLNEYGLYRLTDTTNRIVVNSEAEIFGILGLVYLTPAERQIL